MVLDTAKYSLKGVKLPAPGGVTVGGVAQPQIVLFKEGAQQATHATEGGAAETDVEGGDGGEEKEEIGVAADGEPFSLDSETDRELKELLAERGLKVPKPADRSKGGLSLGGNVIFGPDAALLTKGDIDFAFEGGRVSRERFASEGASILKNPNLVVRVGGKYLKWAEEGAAAAVGDYIYGSGGGGGGDDEEGEQEQEAKAAAKKGKKAKLQKRKVKATKTKGSGGSGVGGGVGEVTAKAFRGIFQRRTLTAFIESGLDGSLDMAKLRRRPTVKAAKKKKGKSGLHFSSSKPTGKVKKEKGKKKKKKKESKQERNDRLEEEAIKGSYEQESLYRKATGGRQGEQEYDIKNLARDALKNQAREKVEKAEVRKRRRIRAVTMYIAIVSCIVFDSCHIRVATAVIVLTALYTHTLLHTSLPPTSAYKYTHTHSHTHTHTHTAGEGGTKGEE